MRNKLSLLGMILTAVGLLGQVVYDYVEEKKTEEYIDNKIDEKLVEYKENK